MNPDPNRMWATVYERAAWLHDVGEHTGSEHPYAYCSRCEMEHPLGRFQVLRAAAEDVLREWAERGDGGCTLSLQERLREAVYGVEDETERQKAT